MASERVTIQVESNIGEDGPLTVADTLRQFMDAFDLISSAIAQEVGGDAIRWRLVSLSKNSPATAIAEAYSADPAVTVIPMVYRGKRRFTEGMAALGNGDVVPWIGERLDLAKSLLSRNLNGIGRTVFDLNDDAPRTVIVEKIARAGLATIEQHEASKNSTEIDKSRSEFGTIEGNVLEATTYYGKPALYLRERISGRTVRCVLSEHAAKEAGPSHSWQDTWTSRRVRIKGQIFYDKAGAIARISASSVKDINPEPPNLLQLQRTNILEGKPPTEYLNSLWGYDD